MPRPKNEQTTVELIKSLADQNGCISAEVVVATATPEDHPLHHEFVWDNDIAGHQFRLGQARALIRQVEAIEYETVIEHKYHVPYFIRDPQMPAHEQGYKAITEIRKNPHSARLALHRELSVAAAHLHRARNIGAALGFEDEIDDLIARVMGLQNRSRPDDKEAA